MLTKKSRWDLAEDYLQILSDTSEYGDIVDRAGNAGSATEKILASLNYLADSDTGNPISIDSKIEILDLMKKWIQQQATDNVSSENNNLLVVIDSLKHMAEQDLKDQYERYYGQQVIRFFSARKL